MPAHGKAIMETLDKAECLRLVSTQVIGRLAFVGFFLKKIGDGNR